MEAQEKEQLKKITENIQSDTKQKLEKLEAENKILKKAQKKLEKLNQKTEEKFR